MNNFSIKSNRDQRQTDAMIESDRLCIAIKQLLDKLKSSVHFNGYLPLACEICRKLKVLRTLHNHIKATDFGQKFLDFEREITVAIRNKNDELSNRTHQVIRNDSEERNVWDRVNALRLEVLGLIKSLSHRRITPARCDYTTSKIYARINKVNLLTENYPQLNDYVAKLESWVRVQLIPHRNHVDWLVQQERFARRHENARPMYTNSCLDYDPVSHSYSSHPSDRDESYTSHHSDCTNNFRYREEDDNYESDSESSEIHFVSSLIHVSDIESNYCERHETANVCTNERFSQKELADSKCPNNANDFENHRNDVNRAHEVDSDKYLPYVRYLFHKSIIKTRNDAFMDIRSLFKPMNSDVSYDDFVPFIRYLFHSKVLDHLQSVFSSSSKSFTHAQYVRYLFQKSSTIESEYILSSVRQLFRFPEQEKFDNSHEQHVRYMFYTTENSHCDETSEHFVQQISDLYFSPRESNVESSQPVKINVKSSEDLPLHESNLINRCTTLSDRIEPIASDVVFFRGLKPIIYDELTIALCTNIFSISNWSITFSTSIQMISNAFHSTVQVLSFVHEQLQLISLLASFIVRACLFAISTDQLMGMVKREKVVFLVIRHFHHEQLTALSIHSNEMESLLKEHGITRLWNNCSCRPLINFTRHRLHLAVHAVTKYPPFFLNHAREFAFLASDSALNPTKESPIEDRVKFIEKFKQISADIIQRMKNAHDRNKRYYDKSRSKTLYKGGDLIYYRNFVLSDANKAFCKKLAPIYLPGKITQVVSDLAYLVENIAGKPVGKFHVQDLRPRSATKA